jgi:apolipoprotein N-acyltransferase
VTTHAADDRSSALRSFGYGWLTGMLYFTGTVYWVVGVMTTYGGLPAIVGLLVGFLLAAYLSLYVALFAWALSRAVKHAGVTGVWMAPFFWVAGEWLRGWIGGGFPWVFLGTSQASVLPVAQAASVVGVYGLSALVALVSTAAAVLAVTTRPVHRRAVAGVAVGLALVVAAGAFRVHGDGLTRTGPVLRVGIVQGAVEQGVKWDPAHRLPILDRHLQLSRQVIGRGAGLVVWPESSTPFFFDAEPPMAAPVRQLAAESSTPFIIGTDEYEAGRDGAPDRIYNTALLVDATGRSRATYRKMHLVPFGE